MYHHFYHISELYKLKNKELNKVPHYRYSKKSDVKNMKPVICEVPVIAQLPQCQCQH
ncbi:hypothetical protein SM124_22720 [Bacillus sp. 31A1R]|uniref:Uncharacterized protein n=1 Tax=Robertmurraya mangrovi TaxID=3098077 RepID=A0ABU5J4Z2_9BACI|nr:hypothetical protein [Bacillus sp. 31A1R]MDZ5474493.1 hypothetical protein [Bacillus sp. 31A1R]